jgi:hypothetical protein
MKIKIHSIYTRFEVFMAKIMTVFIHKLYDYVVIPGRVSELELTEDNFPSLDTEDNHLELYPDSKFLVKYSYRDHKCNI